MQYIKLPVIIAASLAIGLACKAPDKVKNEWEAQDTSAILTFANEDFKNYLISLGYDKNKDGELSEQEAAAIKNLQIKDLTDLADDMTHLSNLKSFDGSWTYSNTENLPSLNFSAAKDIEEIKLLAYGFNQFDLAVHENLKSFTFLYGDGSAAVSDKYDFIHFAAMPNLETLTVAGFSESGSNTNLHELFAQSTGLKKLKSLTLMNGVFHRPATATSVVDLSRSPDLTELNIIDMTVVPQLNIIVYLHPDVKDKHIAGTFTPTFSKSTEEQFSFRTK